MRHPTDEMLQQALERTRNIGHSDFVRGMEAGSFFCLFVSCEPYEFFRGRRKYVFIAFVILYALSPIIIFPPLAYFINDWWLLLGIAFSYLASRAAAREWNVILLIACYGIGAFLATGFHFSKYIVIFFLCSLLGYFLFQLAEMVQRFFALEALFDDVDLYYDAIAQNKIAIFDRQHN